MSFALLCCHVTANDFHSQAQNEALTALDFVSLLISKDAPQQAKLTMSPALSQMGIAGMLAYDKLPASRPSPAEIEHTKSIAVGMTCRSLQTAADALVASANRLEAEMKREARYWEQVLSVSDRGWAVCKLPRDRHTLAVRFGFSEGWSRFGSSLTGAPANPAQHRRRSMLAGSPLCARMRQVTLFSIKDSPIDHERSVSESRTQTASYKPHGSAQSRTRPNYPSRH